MSLTCVKMSEEVWLTCLTHALSTETEEIMGLLLGDIQHSKNGNVTALIWAALPQPRSDRQKDRVETNPEQLTAASLKAERMTLATGRMTRVIGWYHSHPHITVLPSHVDVRTQAMYQLLDSGFIGLIFSCYSEDAHKVGRIQVIAFQSLDGKQSQMLRAVPIPSANKSVVIDLESSSSSLENLSTSFGSGREVNHEEDTGDSKAARLFKGSGSTSELGGFLFSADAGREGSGNSHANGLENALVDLDPMDMSDSMQEALHRSNLDMSGAEFVRKEIPLHVMPTSSFVKFDNPLDSYTDLQRVLYEEEQTAYDQAILQNMRDDGKLHPLTYIHHTSTYQSSLCKLMEYCLSPAISALQDRLKENEIRLAILAEESKVLENEIRGKDRGLVSPRKAVSQGARGSSPFGHKDVYNNPASPRSGSRKGY